MKLRTYKDRKHKNLPKFHKQQQRLLNAQHHWDRTEGNQMQHGHQSPGSLKCR